MSLFWWSSVQCCTYQVKFITLLSCLFSFVTTHSKPFVDLVGRTNCHNLCGSFILGIPLRSLLETPFATLPAWHLRWLESWVILAKQCFFSLFHKLSTLYILLLNCSALFPAQDIDYPSKWRRHWC